MRDSLLRTFASVPVSSRVWVAEESEHADDLRALGFELVRSLSPNPEGAEWAALSLRQPDADALGKARAALIPGGWVWLSVAMTGASRRLDEWAVANGLAVAQNAVRDPASDTLVGVYRRVGRGVTE